MSQSIPFKGYVILVVEDDPLIGMDLAMRLEDAGGVIIGPCRSATAALSALNDYSRPHVAVLDVDLGDHTSEDVARRLQAIHVPIVFYTAQAPDDGSIYDGVPATVVRKPDTGQKILTAIAIALQTSDTTYSK